MKLDKRKWFFTIDWFETIEYIFRSLTETKSQMQIDKKIDKIRKNGKKRNLRKKCIFNSGWLVKRMLGNGFKGVYFVHIYVCMDIFLAQTPFMRIQTQSHTYKYTCTYIHIYIIYTYMYYALRCWMAVAEIQLLQKPFHTYSTKTITDFQTIPSTSRGYVGLH